MPAPTALLRRPDELAEALAVPLPPSSQSGTFVTIHSTNGLVDADEDDILVESAATMPPQALTSTTDQESAMQIDEEGRPRFPPAKAIELVHRVQTRKVLVPPHRMTPLKSSWSKIYPPVVEHLKLQVRMNVKGKAVELRTSKYTTNTGALQKGEDFIKAFTLGFDVDDAIALLRLDDLYIETFGEICKVFSVSLLTFPLPQRSKTSRPLTVSIWVAQSDGLQAKTVGHTEKRPFRQYLKRT